MDWWREFMTGDGKPVGSRGEHTHRNKAYSYFKRSSGDWHVDERRDEDPRHHFTVRQVCDRCGQSQVEILGEHLEICPFSHDGEGTMMCRLELLCEAERRKQEGVLPWMIDPSERL